MLAFEDAGTQPLRDSAAGAGSATPMTRHATHVGRPAGRCTNTPSPFFVRVSMVGRSRPADRRCDRRRAVHTGLHPPAPARPARSRLVGSGALFRTRRGRLRDPAGVSDRSAERRLSALRAHARARAAGRHGPGADGLRRPRRAARVPAARLPASPARALSGHARRPRLSRAPAGEPDGVGAGDGELARAGRLRLRRHRINSSTTWSTCPSLSSACWCGHS